MKQDRPDGDGFIIESDLFPAFRKREKLRPEIIENRPPLFQPEPAQKPDAEPASGKMKREAEDLLNSPAVLPEPTVMPEEEESVPALFGDISIEKFRKQAEDEQADREPTLLEFLNEPLDGNAAAVPSLFEGIGRLYPSEEVLRLAGEQEKIEAEERQRREEAERASQNTAEQDEPQEPPPEPEELFDMISCIYKQQQEDWERHIDGITSAHRVKKDPYNTAFNNRVVEINYDNIGELSMENKYKLSQITEQEENAIKMKYSGGSDRSSGGAGNRGLRFNRRGRHS